jgi:hypothetical protein
MTKQVATKEETAVAVFEYGEDAGGGFENQTADHFRVPLIKLAQKLSPEVDEDLGISPGDFFASDTKVPYKQLHFVPVTTIMCYNEYVTRDNGGGMVGSHKPEAAVVQEAIKANGGKYGKLYTEEGNELIQTFNMFVVILDEESNPVDKAIIPFTSTKISEYQGYNKRLASVRINGQRPPMFSHRVTLSSVLDENKKGKFYNVRLKPMVDNDIRTSMIPSNHPAYLEAKDFKATQVDTGLAQPVEDTNVSEKEEAF